MTKKLPKFLTEKGDIAKFLLCVSTLSLVFSLIYRPNISIKGLESTAHPHFYFLAMLIGVGIILLTASRMLFYKLNKKENYTINDVYIWAVLEIIIITLVLSFISLQTTVPHTRPYLTGILPKTFLSVLSLLAIPNVICYLYFSLREKNTQIIEMETNRKLMKKHELTKDTINFYDEKGVFRLSIRLEDLLFIQSADNYVFINYLNNKQEQTKFTLRNTLKSMEENFHETNLIRCHRFYIVNLQKVRVLKKEKEGLVLELDTPQSTEIPVSKTYMQNIAEKFGNS